MPFQDRYGLTLSTSSDEAAVAYREGVDLMLAAWPGAAEAFDRASIIDPEFALAHIARARTHFTYAEAAAAKTRIALARECVARLGTERERSHVEAMALGMEGKSARSLALSLAHLDRWPRDALVMVLPLGAFGLFAFSGMADHNQARVDLCERHARHYGDDWWFLTYLGWSHTENGSVGPGRRITQRAFEARRENAHAVHALAHAMFEDGSIEDADTLILDWLPSYHRAGLMYGHICWHHALIALEQDDAERALGVYAGCLHPKVSMAPPINVVTDTASLLWRLKIYGHEVQQDVWSEAAAYAERCYPNAGIPFADVHMALVAAATGDHAALTRRIDAIDHRLADGKLPHGPVLPAICRAIHAFADERYNDCIQILEPVATEVVRIGGSHAQREIIEDTLLVALMKSGNADRARTILDERLHRRPSARDARWRASA